MKRLLKIKSPHIKTGNIEKFNDIDFTPVFKYIKNLKNIKYSQLNIRLKQIENLNINNNLKKKLSQMIKKEFNNIEFSDSYFNNFIDGISTQKLVEINDVDFDESVILICFYNNFENFVEKWMNHYISIGIKNFVMVDNNSTDNSTYKIKKYNKLVNISFWKINEMYHCYKMCGWRQQILEFYGPNRKYLTVDSDELFIYEGYKNIQFDDFLKSEKLTYIKSLMMDVYTKNNLFYGVLEEFKYIDKGTYKISTSVSYGNRFFGGPISRVFNITPSLQKIPFITYTGKEIFANDHFYYPWDINNKAKFCSFLLHYKFLPGNKEKYRLFVKDGRHWNESSQYKIYNKITNNSKKITFFDDNISILIDDIKFLF